MVRSAAPGGPPPIVLIGGGAGTGTAAVAGHMARDLGVLLLRTDDCWRALKEVVPRDQQPALHLFPGMEGAEQARIGELVEQFRKAAGAVCEALEPSIRYQAHAGPGLVVEGAWLLPAFAAALSLPGEGAAKAAFLFEPSRAELRATMEAEAGGAANNEPRHRLADLSYEYGAWLRGECQRLGIPAVTARPLATAPRRAAEALGLPVPARTESRG